jgi:hypothetical protein
MAHGIEDVQRGWKVFAGPDELGSVKDVGDGELVVTKGIINRHEYHVPAELIEETDPEHGVVDLSVDRAALEQREA